MKIKELKNKIVIEELDPKARYICLVNRNEVRAQDLPPSKRIWYIMTRDINNSLKFVAVPKLPWWRRVLGL